MGIEDRPKLTEGLYEHICHVLGYNPDDVVSIRINSALASVIVLSDSQVLEYHTHAIAQPEL